MSFLRDVKAPDTNQDQKQSEKAVVVPTSLASLILGAVGGEHNWWYVQYTENKIFRDTCQKIKDRTGVDVSGIIAACVALHSAKNYIPDLAKGVVQHIKAQATSSITLGPNDSALQDALLRFIRDSNSDANKTWWGKHEQRDKDGKLQYLTGEAKPMFWFDKTWFMLDEPSDETRSAILSAAPETYTPRSDPLTIRCLGQSNEPIIMLLEHIKMEQLKSEQLQVYKVMAGADRTEDKRDKRLISSIDMEPRMTAQVLQEVNNFFHEDTPKLYRDTSRPHRMGFLLYGPPGTGKTSLSLAIASHVSRALVIINLQGMDDSDLEAAFANLPLPCVVLIEDIDACSADVGARSKPVQKKLEVLEEPEEQVNKVEVAGIIEDTLSRMVQKFDEKLHELKAAQQNLEASNDEFVRQMQEQMNYGNFEEDENHDNWSPYSQKDPAANPREAFKRPMKPPPASNLNKSVSLQGLLNVIDGPAAVENRLLLMTTNYPEKLDPALTRAGRCDSKYHIGYATPNSAEQTFKRLFGADSCKLHQIDAINRFAQAFKEKFPVNSEVPTCDLAKFCGLYRNRPVEAIRDFPRWLREGDEMFAYSIAAVAKNEEVKVNEPRPFDESLLEVRPEDLIQAVTLDKTDANPKEEAKRFVFNPMYWWGGSTSTDNQKSVSLNTSASTDKQKSGLSDNNTSEDKQDSNTPNGTAGFSVAHDDLGYGDVNGEDVEFDELPELTLYDMIPSMLCPRLAPSVDHSVSTAFPVPSTTSTLPTPSNLPTLAQLSPAVPENEWLQFDLDF